MSTTVGLVWWDPLEPGLLFNGWVSWASVASLPEIPIVSLLNGTSLISISPRSWQNQLRDHVRRCSRTECSWNPLNRKPNFREVGFAESHCILLNCRQPIGLAESHWIFLNPQFTTLRARSRLIWRSKLVHDDDGLWQKVVS